MGNKLYFKHGILIVLLFSGDWLNNWDIELFIVTTINISGKAEYEKSRWYIDKKLVWNIKILLIVLLIKYNPFQMQSWENNSNSDGANVV